MLSRLREKRKYLLIAFVVVFIISVGLNLHNILVIQPQMQADINDMRVGALRSWISEMHATVYTLGIAENTDDFLHAYSLIRYAYLSRNTLLTGIDWEYYPQYMFVSPQNFYYWIGEATGSLEYVVYRIKGLGSDPFISQKDPFILQKIENISRAIGDIRDSMWIETIGVDPVQQLQEKGKLTDIINYCKQIDEACLDIVKYIRDESEAR